MNQNPTPLAAARRLALFLGLGIVALLINYFFPRKRVTALYDRVRGFKNS